MHRDRDIRLNDSLPYAREDDLVVRADEVVVPFRNVRPYDIYMQECLSYQVLHTLEML